jgi:heme oxygenase
MNATELIVANRNRGPAANRAIDLLREETSTAHARLDANLRLVDRLSAVDRRGQLLAGYHLLHRETEDKIAPVLGEIADLEFPARRRAPLIAESLNSLGQNPRVVSPTSPDKLTRAAPVSATTRHA